MNRSQSALLVLISIWTLSAPRIAGAASKEECLDAHGKGQDLRDKGQLVKARQTFLQCAQSSCPAVVQADCARFGEELGHLVPTVTFAARDARAGDLPNTTVWVDDVLTASRLDDGRSYEVDPGRHMVKFVHQGRETTLPVVVGQGEKGRLVVATFGAEGARAVAEPAAEKPEGKRPVFPLVLAGIGGAALVTGGALAFLGYDRVPSSCSFSTHECAAPARGEPDPTERAASGTRLANVGMGVGAAGAVVLITGLVWYYAQPESHRETRRGALPMPGFTF